MASFLKKNNSISFKISLSLVVLTACSILVIFLVGHSIYTFKKSNIRFAENNTILAARDYANLFKSTMEDALIITNTLSKQLLGNTSETSTLKVSREIANEVLIQVLIQNKWLLGTWTIWEPNAFDGNDSLFASTDCHDSTGRFIPYWVRGEDGKIHCEAVAYYEDQDGDGDFYQLPKKGKKEMIVGPFYYNGIFMVSIVTPILKDDKFYGVVGCDVSIGWIQNWVDSVKFYNGKGIINIIAADGTIVAAQGRKELVGKKVEVLHLAHIDKWRKSEKTGVFIVNDTLFTYVPFYIGQTDQQWLLNIAVPIEVLTAEADEEMAKLLIGGIILLIAFVYIVNYFLKKLVKPIKAITISADKVLLGNLNYKSMNIDSAEIKQLDEVFSKLVAFLKDITKVCTAVANGDFTQRVCIRSEKDELGKSVNQMIENLKKAAEEDKIRSWVTEGLAKFGNILRAGRDIKKLSEDILSNLVKDLELNQGWMFLLNDSDANDEYLELVACYAYDRKKFLKKRVEIGEGLAGQCYLEKSTIYLTKIPDDYAKIKSGLGDCSPSCVLIVPLKFNDKVEGVMELASYNKLKEHEIAFVEKLAENIASTISNLKVNERTKVLLNITQTQAEEIRVQKEEMLQKMEDLRAAYEEIKNKEQEYLQQIAHLRQELERRYSDKSNIPV
ncbi:MAG: cache domain-containing protein [Cytophagales bacterium]|nr:cache domain-containing protein [Cytophagales bacterium]MDW8385359.1 cache domain-containing protein [Flammeovirgaceae bacterium]